MLPDNEKDYNFVERTQENLRFVSKVIRGEDVKPNDFNDFTNLINSCLGLLSYVYEYVFDNVESNNPPLSRQQLTLLTLQELGSILGTNSCTIGTIIKCCGYNTNNPDIICADMPNMLRHIRNAICHGNMRPISKDSSNRAIVKVSLWDEPLNKQNPDDKNFEVEMTLEQLENFANDIATAYNKWEKSKNL